MTAMRTRPRIESRRGAEVSRNGELVRTLREIAGLAVQSPDSRFLFPVLREIERKAREAIRKQ
jgi:hypothetical protein